MSLVATLLEVDLNEKGEDYKPLIGPFDAFKKFVRLGFTKTRTKSKQYDEGHAVYNHLEKLDFVLLAYLTGMQCVQMLFNIQLDTEGEDSWRDNLIKDLIQVLEKIKIKHMEDKVGNFSLLSAYHKTQKDISKNSFREVIAVEDNSRRFLNYVSLQNIEIVEKHFRDGKISWSTLEYLFDTITLLQISNDMFPYNETEDIKEVETGTNDEVNANLEQEEEGEDKDGEHSIECIDSEERAASTVKIENEDPNDNINIQEESDYFQKELDKAEREFKDMTVNQHIFQDFNETSRNQIKELDLSSAEIKKKIEFCKFHSYNIFQDLKSGKDPNLNFENLLNSDHLPSFVSKGDISNEDIERVLNEVLSMPDNSYDTDVNDDYYDSDEFNEDNYTYDSDSGEYVRKNDPKRLERKFPAAPMVTSPENEDSQQLTKDTKHETVKEKEEKDFDEKLAVKKVFYPTVATNSHLHSPIDREKLKKEIDNSDMLENAIKNCKYAVSAISMEDLDTAKAELGRALELIEKYETSVNSPP